jgi:hypothetical protein
VIISGASNSMNTLGRIRLWLGSLLVYVTLFSLLFTLHFSGPGVLPRQVGPSHFSRHYDICVSGLVPVSPLRDCT